VAYDCGGTGTTDFPASVPVLAAAKPVLKTFAGWKQPLHACRTYDALPQNARDYVKFIEDFCETPVQIVSVGYEREATIVRKAVW
jgi:adenylosuccinate synthase